jgi:class 3 adenylate cyclase
MATTVTGDVVGLSGNAGVPGLSASPGCAECDLERLAGRNYCGACGKPLRPRCERKQVTVLFADVSGFTALSAQLDAEQVSEIMHQTFDIVLEAVHENGGTVNQFLGDGVMALFADGPFEHHASRALGAALAIQERLETVRHEVQQIYGREFRVRIGINTGPVVIGTIGPALRTDYTATGSTASAALGLLHIAEPGQIVVTEHTRELAVERFAFAEVGAIPLTESREPVIVYELSHEKVRYAEDATLMVL